jgi:hypothetical protein
MPNYKGDHHMFREIFDHETYRNIAIILMHARKKIVSSYSPELIKATLMMTKDVAAAFAAGIVSGLPMDNWGENEKLLALWDRADISCESFERIVNEQFPSKT